MKPSIEERGADTRPLQQGSRKPQRVVRAIYGAQWNEHWQEKKEEIRKEISFSANLSTTNLT
jgi:hypothetical protein